MTKSFEKVLAERKVDMIHSAFVVNSLYEQQKLGKHCDLKVLIGEKQYFVHRCILAAASTQLDSQINGLDAIQLVGVTCYGFECLLEILYSGKLSGVHNLCDSKFLQIVTAADALDVKMVMEYCARERRDLMDIVIRKVSSNSTAILSTFQNQDQDVSTHNNSDDVQDLQMKGENVQETLKTKHPDKADLHKNAVEVGNDLVKEGISKERNHNFLQNPVATEMKVHSFPENEANKYKTQNGLTCRVCQDAFLNIEDLNNHLHTHSGEKLFRCEVCGLHFKLLSLFASHQKTHFICQMCGQDFKSPSELKIHSSEAHSDLDEPLYSMNNKSESSSRDNRITKRSSGITPSMTRNKVTEKPTINPIEVNDIARGANGKFQCPLCERGFDRRWNLKCHVLIHTSSKKSGRNSGDARYIEATFTCPKCGKLFHNLHNLRRHASSIHGMNAADLAEANEGMPGQHSTASKRPKRVAVNKDYKVSEEYKFWCDDCGRGFKRHRNLRGHMETHQSEGNTKYECYVCNRTFPQKESLNGHLWVHKSTNPET